MKNVEEKSSLIQKIRTKKVRSGIIGLGYVGLPLAVEFARVGIEVIGIDNDPQKVQALLGGKSYIQDVSSADLEKLVHEKKLKATSDYSIIRELDVINICVPTPLRKTKDPDISYILSAAQEIAKYLHDQTLIILESTTYPGTTEEVILPLLEETGLRVGKDFYLAFSPERIDPGNPDYNTRNIPRVVGGVTAQCAALAKAYYELAVEKVHVVSGARAAEMVKLLENTFRSVNIGLINELCLMSERLGVDIWEVIDAAATKPFGFIPFYPGPGLGGHCIPIDPHYLAWKARLNGFSPHFIELASEVNASMPEFVVHKTQSILNEQGKALKGAAIFVLGVTYKKNVADIRESPALEIIQLLLKQGARIYYNDPYVSQFELEGKVFQSTSLDTLREKIDLSILITNHDKFNYAKILELFPAILDTRNAFREMASSKVYKI
jgi:UDP-N-acetyl-D-glucosamine dehydrogenase